MKNQGFWGVLLVALVLVSCNGNDPQKGVSDKVKTMEVTNIASRQVTMWGGLKMEVNQYRSVEYGFIYTTDLKALKQHKGTWVQAYGLENDNEFSEEVSDLEPLTKYYVCTWVFVNKLEYEYGNVLEFKTNALGEALVQTELASEVAIRCATLNGRAVWDKGRRYQSIELGFVYGTDGSAVQAEQGIKKAVCTLTQASDLRLEEYAFALPLTELQPATSYYYRAYMQVAADSVLYGEIREFETQAFVNHEHAFMISENLEQVYFANGNLQYQPKTDTWRFAENPWDFVGQDNKRINDTSYVGWIDLFGWGTGDCPTKYRNAYGDYLNFVDWGVNQIGTDEPNTWRTLSIEEWNYVLFGRPNAEQLRALIKVNRVNGLLLLPDDWEERKEITSLSNITLSNWTILEAAGAVFLPMAGRRSGTNVYSGLGYYWSSSKYPSHNGKSWCISFSTEGYHSWEDYYTDCGHSVRLVRDAR